MSEEKIQVVAKRDIALIVAALCLMALTAVIQVANVIIVQGQNEQLHRDAKLAIQTHHGVCTYRKNLEDQVRQTDQFLATHPHGIPGISAVTFRQGEAKQRAAIESLSDLHCP